MLQKLVVRSRWKKIPFKSKLQNKSLEIWIRSIQRKIIDLNEYENENEHENENEYENEQQMKIEY